MGNQFNPSARTNYKFYVLNFPTSALCFCHYSLYTPIYNSNSELLISVLKNLKNILLLVKIKKVLSYCPLSGFCAPSKNFQCNLTTLCYSNHKPQQMRIFCFPVRIFCIFYSLSFFRVDLYHGMCMYYTTGSFYFVGKACH